MVRAPCPLPPLPAAIASRRPAAQTLDRFDLRLRARTMDQHQREDQRHLLLHKEEEQDDSLRTWKEQLLGPDVVHTTSLLGEKTSSVQLQGSPGNAACSVLSSSVGPSEALPIVVGLAWTLQNGGNAAPMQSPGVDSLSVHKRGRGRPRKDQQSRQANPPPPPTPTASRRGIKVTYTHSTPPSASPADRHGER
uniref:Uncharacterized protein n=1 Tax=Aegilops tauschii subsp. strangulata TaxID=200361 RepID=A0A453A647_AEGTS